MINFMSIKFIYLFFSIFFLFGCMNNNNADLGKIFNSYNGVNYNVLTFDEIYTDGLGVEVLGKFKVVNRQSFFVGNSDKMIFYDKKLVNVTRYSCFFNYVVFDIMTDEMIEEYNHESYKIDFNPDLDN